MKRNNVVMFFIVLLVVLMIGSSIAGSASKVTVLKLGHIWAADGPPSAEASKIFAKKVAEKTNGTVKIDIFPAQALGSEEEMIESVSIGALDMSLSGAGVAGRFQKQYSFSPVAYLIEDWDHLERMMRGALGKEMEEKFLKNTGARVLSSLWVRPPRVLFSSKPVRSINDLKGIRIRVPEHPAWIASWKKLGASPTPMPLAELFLALEQGIVDAGETDIAYAYPQGFHKVAPYFMLTNHQLETDLLIISERVFKKLTSKQQKALVEAAKETEKAIKDIVIETDKKYLEKLKEDGATIFTEKDIKIEEWIEKTGDLGKELEHIYGKGMYERIKSYAK